MVRNMTSHWDQAGFARAQGWKPGDRLRGGNIEHGGKVLETGREIILTALGEHVVLARAVARLDADGNKVATIADTERMVGFDSREWELVTEWSSSTKEESHE